MDADKIVDLIHEILPTVRVSNVEFKTTDNTVVECKVTEDTITMAPLDYIIGEHYSYFDGKEDIQNKFPENVQTSIKVHLSYVFRMIITDRNLLRPIIENFEMEYSSKPEINCTMAQMIKAAWCINRLDIPNLSEFESAKDFKANLTTFLQQYYDSVKEDYIDRTKAELDATYRISELYRELRRWAIDKLYD